MLAVMASDAPLPSAPFDPCVRDNVAGFVREISGAVPPPETRIHPADEMYRFELEAPHRTAETAAVFYFAIGRSIFRTVSEVAAWRFGGFEKSGSLLDFACGYGRATRFLARALAPSRITAAEIDPGAVRFQEETFGVRGCLSDSRPEALELSGPFGVVLAVSLFSHLPPATFEAWLSRLYGLVSGGGILVFSTNGPPRLPEGRVIPESGILFAEESETARLALSEYGSTWVTEAFVRSAAERASHGEAMISVHPLGLCGFQDLYVMVRPPHAPLPELRLARDPLGALERASVEGGIVRVAGWAAGDRDERPPDVRLHLGSRVEAVSSGEGPSGARREWRFEFPAAAVSADALVRVEAESARGATRLLVAETLRPYLGSVLNS